MLCFGIRSFNSLQKSADWLKSLFSWIKARQRWLNASQATVVTFDKNPDRYLSHFDFRIQSAFDISKVQLVHYLAIECVIIATTQVITFSCHKLHCIRRKKIIAHFNLPSKHSSFWLWASANC